MPAPPPARPSEPTLSVLIYSYRRPEMLTRCLARIELQVNQPLEVLVVAKSWDPETVAMAAGRARVILVEREDIATAITAGLNAARGEVVAIIDDDAEAGPDWTARINRHFADPSVGAVGGRDELIIDGTPVPASASARVGQITWYGAVLGNHHLGIGQARDVDVLKGCNMAVRKSLVAGVSPALLGPYTYRWEDDLCGQVRAYGKRLVYDPNLKVLHNSARPTAARGYDDPRSQFVSAFNLAYVQLKYLQGWRRVTWLAFSIMVGQPDDPGFARIRQRGRLWWPAFRGKLGGIRAAWRTR